MRAFLSAVFHIFPLTSKYKAGTKVGIEDALTILAVGTVKKRVSIWRLSPIHARRRHAYRYPDPQRQAKGKALQTN